MRAIPRDLRGRLEPAEIFHQLLEHRWYQSQAEGRDVPIAEALTSYINDVLRHRRDESMVIAPETESITLPVAIQAEQEMDAEDWRSKV